MANQIWRATVTGTAPLTIAMYGEDPAVDVPAVTLGSYTPVVDDKVWIETRRPLAPLIHGLVT